MCEYIAHIRKGDKAIQSLEEHLLGTAWLARANFEKLGLGGDLNDWVELLGLLHDLGKYSKKFQDYIRLPEGADNQDADENEATEEESQEKISLKGRIDHSTAGAQLAWQMLASERSSLLAQASALVLASHHSGLIDCITPDGTNKFLDRMSKQDDLTFLNEVKSKISPDISERIEKLSGKSDTMTTQLSKHLLSIMKKSTVIGRPNFLTYDFSLGLFARLVFSCLIDADRTDTIDFENKRAGCARSRGSYVSWDTLIERLEKHMALLESPKDAETSHVNRWRRDVSNQCRYAAERDRGLFTLTVPTGGGKTLSSLRFALHHAKKYDLDRIFYIVPFTTIIDQNAGVVRDILEQGKERGKVVLECHSNLSPERETWLSKLLSENWDTPIVFTTSVQFFDALFAGGTRSVRRMHQLARSVIIFDEVQSVPIKLVHMFCNAVNFLVKHCSSSAVLCTATQPLLNKVNSENGSLDYTENNEIISDVEKLFDVFSRVNLFYEYRPGGYSNFDAAGIAVEECDKSGSALVIVNTTGAAREVYKYVKERFDNVIHLSARMCPAHRAKIFKKLNEDLRNSRPVICVATQVIEAGVDVDFGSVIRYIAGLDSIAQAAGRCNRHGRRDKGRVILLNNEEENLKKLPDILDGKNISMDMLDKFDRDRSDIGSDLLTGEFMDAFYERYFYRKKDNMSYTVQKDRRDTLLNVLSRNSKAVDEYEKKEKKKPGLSLKQSFMTAGREFRAIDAPTRSLIVPYGDGRDIIAGLCSDMFPEAKLPLLRRAQQYAVNIYPGDFEGLIDKGAVYEIKTDTGRKELGIWALRENFYSDEFGVNREGESKMGLEVT